MIFSWGLLDKGALCACVVHGAAARCAAHLHHERRVEGHGLGPEVARVPPVVGREPGQRLAAARPGGAGGGRVGDGGEAQGIGGLHEDALEGREGGEAARPRDRRARLKTIREGRVAAEGHGVDNAAGLL